MKAVPGSLLLTQAVTGRDIMHGAYLSHLGSTEGKVKGMSQQKQ